MRTDHSSRSAEDAGVQLPVLSDEELFSLELRWYEGRMLPYVEWLLDFAERNRADILDAAGPAWDAKALMAETKRRIRQLGSVHLVAELSDQRREMENELWYRGERGEYDRAAIQIQWCTRHAAAWRRWRIHEYLFVADRCEALITRVLAPDALQMDRTGAKVSSQ